MSKSDLNPVKVSIICSAYNREKYLKQCVESILNQTLKDIEIILIDNGSVDNTPQIVDEFARKDKRVVAVHNPQGSTYGKALNQGVSLAKGKYIGIVESDDWIDATMYEKMYQQAKKFDADVCLCSFSRILENAQIQNETRLLEHAPKDKLFSIAFNPRMWYLHPCIWAKLYKKTLLQKIGFETNEKYLDQPFIARLFTETNKMVCVPEYLYFYRQDNPDASSAKSKQDKSLVRIIGAYEKVKNILKEAEKYEEYKEYIYYHATYVIKAWLGRLSPKYRKAYIKKAYHYYKELKNDSTFSFKFFNTSEKTFVNDVLSKKWKKFKYDEYSSKRILGIPLYERTVKKNISKIKLLGITISCVEKEKDTVYTSYLFNSWRSDKFVLYTQYYCFNIPLFKKIHFLALADNIIRQQKSVSKDMLQVELKRTMEVYALHQSTFPQFRNIHRGQSIAICGAGPTLSFYEPLKNCIHVGVNKVFQNPKLALDYAFILDYKVGRNYLRNLSEYRLGKCKKFYGQLLEQNHDFFIPDIAVSNSDIYRYWVSESNFNLTEDFNYDISTQTLPCFYSIIFQAISFALWTHPKKIYLVGCDANFAGHFDGSPMASKDKTWEHIHRLRNYDGWKKLKKFLSVYYPDIEVISVNPVGLRGMFHDVYTQEYLASHPEIDSFHVELLK